MSCSNSSSSENELDSSDSEVWEPGDTSDSENDEIPLETMSLNQSTIGRYQVCDVVSVRVWCQLIFFLTVSTVVAAAVCPSGTYLSSSRTTGKEICYMCEDRTFMNENNHTHEQCFKCRQTVDPVLEIVHSNCGLHHDTVIQCKDGYYRRRARNERETDACVLCSSCEPITRPCMNYTDTLCCPPKYEAEYKSADVFHCKKQPVLCKSGQYYHDKRDECLSCPLNTYMPDKLHNRTSCIQCDILSENSTEYHSNILHNCSPTSPTLFGCIEGYYRRCTSSLEVNCIKCDECHKLEIKKNCSLCENTVCRSLDTATETMVISTQTLPVWNLIKPSAVSQPESSWQLYILIPLGIIIAILLIIAVLYLYLKKEKTNR